MTMTACSAPLPPFLVRNPRLARRSCCPAVAPGLTLSSTGPSSVGKRIAAVRAPERGKQVGQIDVVVAGFANAGIVLPTRRRRKILAGSRSAELVVGLALFRVFQHCVRFADLLEALFAKRIL